MVLSATLDRTDLAMQGSCGVQEKIDPYTEDKIDKNWKLFCRELIYSTLIECYQNGQQKIAHIKIKRKSKRKGAWRLRNNNIKNQRQRLFAWIKSDKFRILLTAYDLTPDEFQEFLKDVLKGKNTDTAKQLLDEYNMHIKRGRKKSDA